MVWRQSLLIVGSIAIPQIFAVVACVAMVAVSAITLTTAICGRGWIQAFAIGYLIPNVISYLVFIEASGSPEGVMLLVLFSTIVSLVVGLTASAVHGYLRRRGGKILVPNLPLVRNWFSNE